MFLSVDLELYECKFWSCYSHLMTMTDKSEMDERQRIKSRNEAWDLGYLLEPSIQTCSPGIFHYLIQ